MSRGRRSSMGKPFPDQSVFDTDMAIMIFNGLVSMHSLFFHPHSRLWFLRLDSRVKIPTHDDMQDSILPCLRKKVYTEVLNEIANVSAVAIIHDLWMSHAEKTYSRFLLTI